MRLRRVNESVRACLGIPITSLSVMETRMTGRIFRLNECLLRVENRLKLEARSTRSDPWVLLRLWSLRARIRSALRRATAHWVNPHRARRVAPVLGLATRR